MLFFSISLHSKGREKFAFSLSLPNHQGPGCQFHWTVLPQGMDNSPTICQEFVAAAIEPTCHKYPEDYVLHYMDNILISHPSESILLLILEDLTKDLEAWGLCIAPEKVQEMTPFQYLGHGRLICPQKVEIRKDNLKTLNNLQKLLGGITWLRPSLKLTTDTLSPLF
jgi:hypothetical protein